MEYNIRVFAEACGYVAQFQSYQSVKKGKQVASFTKWGLGENIALQLMECLPPTVSYHLFMNNYLLTLRLLIHVGINKDSSNRSAQQKQVTQMHCHWRQTAA